MKHLLFITTANLTTNPRLLKELHLLHNDYICSFVGFKLGNWADDLDEKHRKILANVNFQYLSATRTPFFLWLWSSLLQRIAQNIYPLFSQSTWINAMASDKRAFLLSQYLSHNQKKYDAVIAHNLGALYPAWNFSRKRGIPFSFDIEDYHPGEKIAQDASNEKRRREFLMRQFLPDAIYISYASPLIGQYSLELVDKGKIRKHMLINNSFDSTEFVKPSKVTGKLKLVWLSQYIDAGRGLEKILPVLDQYSERIELHLFGQPRPAFYEQQIKIRKYVTIHGTMTQQELHCALAGFDIGLALESVDQDQNRDICLTNKFFAYVQAGLFVLATDTTAQKQFMQKFSWVREKMEQYYDAIEQKISWILDNIKLIREGKIDRYNKAKDLSWEMDGEKLKKIIANILE